MAEPVITPPMADQGGDDPPFGRLLDQGGEMAKPAFDQGGNFAPGPDVVPFGPLDELESGMGRFPLLVPQRFPRRAWEPGLYATAIVAEFAGTAWKTALQLPPPPTAEAAIRQEIEDLMKMSDQRVKRAAEIGLQAKDGGVYWSDMLMITAASHPATWDMIVAANAAAHLVVMHFKQVHRRPRPAQYYPGLMPLFLTPRHPSYPSGHMLENGTIARALELVVPGQTSVTRAGPLWQLALRIGENREIAGLHFPSDTAASVALVPGVLGLLQEGELFKQLVTEARAEWTGVAAGVG